MYPLITSTVWIVDDDEDDQLFIRSAFQEGEPSINALSLLDGEELLPKLAKCLKLPRLILLDINMPRKDGFETLAELRSVPEFAEVPVIMLTTSSDEEDRRRSLALGAQQFLTKPLSNQQLKVLAKQLVQEWSLT